MQSWNYQFLVEAKVLTERQLAEAVAAQAHSEEPLYQILIARRFITEGALFKLVAKALNIPYVERYKFINIKPAAINQLPKILCLELGLIPLSFYQGRLEVATYQFDRLGAIVEKLAHEASCEVAISLSNQSHIFYFQNVYFKENSAGFFKKSVEPEIVSEIEELEPDPAPEGFRAEVTEITQLSEMGKSAPVTQKEKINEIVEPQASVNLMPPSLPDKADDRVSVAAAPLDGENTEIQSINYENSLMTTTARDVQAEGAKFLPVRTEINPLPHQLMQEQAGLRAEEEKTGQNNLAETTAEEEVSALAEMDVPVTGEEKGQKLQRKIQKAQVATDLFDLDELMTEGEKKE